MSVQTDTPAVEVSRHRRLPRGWQIVFAVSTALSLSLAVYQQFNLGRMLGYVPIDTQYLYLVLMILIPLTFLIYPAHKSAPMDRVPWYDAILYFASLGTLGYFAFYSRDIVDLGWEYAAPDHIVWVSYILWVLALDATRRAGGLVIFFICFFISMYPAIAGDLPGILQGHKLSFSDTVAFHALSSESILGIPTRAFANLVFGFLIFGVALQFTGGGRFFLNLAFALLGHVRGGPAKVAIFASGLMGSMSGSVITNVLTTGALSIPAMRRVGFAPHYAGGVEACASTGGVLMPPIMGATAFVMATFLEVPYIDVVVAAIIPSLLYFFGLFMQIDSYAAENNLKGLPKEELPRLSDTLKEGWIFIAVFAILIWMLVYLQREAIAPYYATVALLVANQILPYNRWKKDDPYKFLLAVGRLFTELAAILAGIGLIVGALLVTGKVGTLAHELVRLAGDSPFILLVMGAVTSFILGIGMTVTAAYLFLAITLAPALTQSDLSPMAVHMFILYWGMLSFITPPVALGAFAASTLAKANPMRTGFEAMRLGSIIYFIPFFFVLNPALIMDGTWQEIIATTATAVVGVIFLAAALQGNLVGVGSLMTHSTFGMVLRGLLLVAALLLATPGGKFVGIDNLTLAVIGIAFAVPVIGFSYFINARARA